MEKEKISLEILLGRPINIEQIGKLYQPNIGELVDFNMDNYNKLLTPFSANVDLLDTSQEEIKDIKNFDLFFIKRNEEEYLLNDNGIRFLDILKQSLEFYFKDTIEIIEEYMAITVGKEGIIHRDNFDELANIIMIINNLEKPKKESVPNFTSEAQKKIWLQLEKGRNSSKAEKEQLNLQTIINCVVHGSETFISYQDVCKMTIWQLMNTYKSILEKEQYKANFSIMLAGCADSKTLDLTHWSEKIKI